MTFDNELTLIKTTGSTTNSIGDSIPNEEKTTVLCDILSVTRSEHYTAMANQMQPELVFVLNKYDYDKQKDVEFEGDRYRVIRTFKPKSSKDIGSIDNIELVCQGVGE